MSAPRSLRSAAIHFALTVSCGAVLMAAMLATGCAARPHDAPSPRGTDPGAPEAISPSAIEGAGATAATESTAPREARPPVEAATADAPVAAPEFIQCTPQIRVDRARGIIELAVVSVLEVGFLEQYVCSPSTREHESLFVFEGKASELHAALLLAGFKPGEPGSWREVPPPEGQPKDGNQLFTAVPPSGDAIRITVVLPDGAEHPLTHFVRASPLTPNADARPPNDFVFAGSRFRTDRRTGVERYLADGSGSIIGLVTFGDETIAAVEVVPDQVSVAPPVWEAFTERMPKPGTRLTLRIARADAVPSASHGAARRSPRSPNRSASSRGQTKSSTGQIKRPGRDRASGRALPGASWGVGIFLPPSRYIDIRFSQAIDLRIRTAVFRNRTIWRGFFSLRTPPEGGVRTCPRPEKPVTALPETPLADGCAMSADPRRVAGRGNLVHACSEGLSLTKNRPPRTLS